MFFLHLWAVACLAPFCSIILPLCSNSSLLGWCRNLEHIHTILPFCVRSAAERGGQSADTVDLWHRVMHGRCFRESGLVCNAEFWAVLTETVMTLLVMLCRVNNHTKSAAAPDLSVAITEQALIT